MITEVDHDDLEIDAPRPFTSEELSRAACMCSS